MKKSSIPFLSALLSLTAISVMQAAPAVANAPATKPEIVGNPAIVPQQQRGAWAAKRFKKIMALPNRTQTPLVFFGDSITEGWIRPTARWGSKIWQQDWVPLHATDFGVGAARTENLLWSMDHGMFDGVHPKLVVLMIGTNNTGQKMEPAEQTAAGVKAIIDELKTKTPQTKILLLAIFPRGATTTDPKRVLNGQINDIIKNYADNQTVFYMDINKDFLQPDGTLSKTLFPDLLHPNEKGYEIWAKAIQPEVQKLMAN